MSEISGRMSLRKYIQQFTSLNVNKSHKVWTPATTYRAPHKPFLLLAVLDLFDRSEITGNLVKPDSSLSYRFANYWRIVYPGNQPGNLTYPFYHLQGDGFWHLLPLPGLEHALTSYRPGTSLTALQSSILGASLEHDLYKLMQIEEARVQLRDVLITSYFSDEIQEVLGKPTSRTIREPAPQYTEWANWIDWE
jgi:predicted restriction endonuclease